jgi:undecaprenyl-diphosphatase
MWDTLLHLDRELLLELNGWGGTGWDQFWLLVSDKWSGLPLYLFLVVFFGRQWGWKRLLIALISIGLLLTASDQLANFFKFGVQRLRPCHEPELSGLLRLVKSSCGGKFGFFSAHAANAMGVAVFFTTLWFRKFRIGMILLLLWALTVGYSRIYIGVHYTSDVLFGFVAGGFLGWLFARLFERASQRVIP